MAQRCCAVPCCAHIGDMIAVEQMNYACLMAGLEEERPWLKPNVCTPAATDPPTAKTRLRPLIYVYDMPPAYNTRMMQAS